MERITYAFGDFRLDMLGHELRRDGIAIALEPKAFDVLYQLLTHAGELLGRDQLLDAVWGHRHVSPGVLNRSIAQLRRALGDDADNPRYIQTAHALGYRFIAPVSVEPATAPASATAVAANVQTAAEDSVQRAARPGATSPPAASVAILPFTDLSQAGDQDYFCDGLAEEILRALTRVPGLQVASRTSS
ncbi:MAG TPA: winged helix-turn-helix domain-containing protein, partial [Lysobacter sp.]|nr:winged helix-turn-helix domain-containing protein [Lysobacter sp.]